MDTVLQQLIKASSVFEKIALLDSFPCIEEFLNKWPSLRTFLAGLSSECESAFKQLIVIGQAESLFQGANPSHIDVEALRDLLEKLVAIDHFYREIGGIYGYQVKILKLLHPEDAFSKEEEVKYHSPFFIDIAEPKAEVLQAIEWGLEALPKMAEIYPLGGAADRLHLIEEKTGLELPAAMLKFGGKTLLEHLITDLQARELLYFKKTGIQLTTPIAIMTSYEKNNHARVMEICEEHNWFNRPKESIRFFVQPLVPVVDKQGNWCRSAPLKPLLKPGGHGAIWKLARDGGIFEWLKEQGRSKALIRQINNPIAGLDYGLLAFTGIGYKKEMIFGFASCPRLLRAAEGVNVLVEREKEIVLSNIEYCDFAKFGIEDQPLKKEEPYSRFSSNTNILFADLEAVEKAVERYPFPGLLVNLKKGSYVTEHGEKKEELMARLESTMQNIADVFVEEKGDLLKTERTFVTYNRRHKTISTTKKAFTNPTLLQETPENCFYDLMKAHRELLLACGFELPDKRTVEEYLEKGPEFLFLYHPALGPLYSEIQAKISLGKLAIGSELRLEIGDFKAEHLILDGSLQIIAEQVMGHLDKGQILNYSTRVGRCFLKNVTIENKGVHWSKSSPFWKMDLQREEGVKIILKGSGQLIAENLHLKGSHTIIVEDNEILRI
jgi:hypothetical protein